MTSRDDENDPQAASGSAPTGPERLFEALRDEDWGRGLPPVQEWHPAREGEIDIRIARDGSWTYQGSPIGRQRMVRLFSTILRRDADDRFYLVTPVEKLAIEVEDAPFVAVEMAVERDGDGAPTLVFRTNVNEVVAAGPEHPIRVETDPATGEPSPYIRVRDRLDALIARSVFYELVDMAETESLPEGERLVVHSGGSRFVLGAVPDESEED
ncbi:DUF1285 domain-containing protein [Marinibaculum pumilum]|uniref:DUF1285 domain-containing protein n=1 Tax=Marinibaculum pumilum TaxID=1766165 RepID=A0ABV7L596_9PROT